jgi:predicted deacetylase
MQSGKAKDVIEENIYEFVLTEEQKGKSSVNWSEAEMERKISKFKSFVEEDYKLSLDKYQALPIEKFHVFTFKCGKHKSKTFAKALKDIPYCK